jgi:hypothetical protein
MRSIWNCSSFIDVSSKNVRQTSVSLQLVEDRLQLIAEFGMRRIIDAGDKLGLSGIGCRRYTI